MDSVVGTESTIRSARFRAEREADWKRLDTIVTQTEKRDVRSLNFDDARDLAVLYRQAMNSLSVARSISLDRSLLEYLEALCSRAYLAVYAPQDTIGGLLWRTLAYSIPQAMRRSAIPMLLSFIGMFLGFLTGYLLFFEDPTWYNTFMPGSLAGSRGISSSAEQLLSVIYDDDPGALDQLGAFAAYLLIQDKPVWISLPFLLSIYFVADHGKAVWHTQKPAQIAPMMPVIVKCSLVTNVLFATIVVAQTLMS